MFVSAYPPFSHRKYTIDHSTFDAGRFSYRKYTIDYGTLDTSRLSYYTPFEGGILLCIHACLSSSCFSAWSSSSLLVEAEVLLLLAPAQRQAPKMCISMKVSTRLLLMFQ